MRRCPVPPVHHGPGLEARPQVVLPLEEEHAVSGDLEAQQGRCVVKKDGGDPAQPRHGGCRHGKTEVEGPFRPTHGDRVS